ncbi:hypothetical protein B0H63DRAFT_452501 [Podospora didyma]|uniref:Uncharacterized protein n=1 Tax=Podospora didyma TaxID=330526 RepID=A0AAE0N949_9PEZI|nr:hypothetical protein B0H63DRAFT_452501 [Podospora didyma]
MTPCMADCCLISSADADRDQPPTPSTGFKSKAGLKKVDKEVFILPPNTSLDDVAKSSLLGNPKPEEVDEKSASLTLETSPDSACDWIRDTDEEKSSILTVNDLPDNISEDHQADQAPKPEMSEKGSSIPTVDSSLGNVPRKPPSGQTPLPRNAKPKHEEAWPGSDSDGYSDQWLFERHFQVIYQAPSTSKNESAQTEEWLVPPGSGEEESAERPVPNFVDEQARLEWGLGAQGLANWSQSVLNDGYELECRVDELVSQCASPGSFYEQETCLAFQMVLENMRLEMPSRRDWKLVSKLLWNILSILNSRIHSTHGMFRTIWVHL